MSSLPCPFVGQSPVEQHTGEVMNRQLNTRYVHEESNWLFSCRACFEQAWADYDDMWDSTPEGCSPFGRIPPKDANV